MENFRKYIEESFKNAIGPNDPLKLRYVDQVWELLQKSYKSMGGLKGSGFSSKEDMIENIPLWKMAVKNGVVEFVILYKDRGGRKSVAVGSTGSDYAIEKAKEVYRKDLGRAFSEKSKSSLGFLLKLYPKEVILQYIKTPEEVSKIMEDDEIIPIKSLPKSMWPKDALFSIEKHPYLLDYGYLRDIGGTLMFKIMVGTSGKRIQ